MKKKKNTEGKPVQTPQQALISFRLYLHHKKPLNTLLSQYFDHDKALQKLMIPLTTSPSTLDKIDLYFNCKCEKFPLCIYDSQELVQAFIQSGYTKKVRFPCKGCGTPLRYKFFFKDQNIQNQIDYYWKEYNLFPKGKFCKEIEISKSSEIHPIFIDFNKTEQNTIDNPSNLDGVLGNSPGIQHMLGQYPELNNYNREKLLEFCYLYEKYVKDVKSDDELLISEYGLLIKNRDIKRLIEKNVISKKTFKLMLFYYWHKISHIQQNILIYMSFKTNGSYKLDENLGNMHTSAQIQDYNIVNFIIRCKIPSKIYTFCQIYTKKSMIMAFIPYILPEKNYNKTVFIVKNLINFIKLHFDIEISALSISWVGMPCEYLIKDCEFGYLALFLFEEIVKNVKNKPNFQDFHDFSAKILWLMLFMASMRITALRKDISSPEFKIHKFQKNIFKFQVKFNDKYPPNDGKFPLEVLISKSSHEIIWNKQENMLKIDFLTKIEKNTRIYEFSPKIEAGNSDIGDIWGFGLKKTENPLKFLETKESQLVFPRKSEELILKYWRNFKENQISEEITKFWQKDMERKETPYLNPPTNDLSEKITYFHEKPDLTKLAEILLEEPYIPPETTIGIRNFKGIEPFDFDTKIIKIKKTELLNLIKHVKNQGILEKKLENMLKSVVETNEVIEELGVPEPKEAVFPIKKKILNKILYAKEVNLLEKLSEEESKNYCNFVTYYQNYWNFIHNKLQLEYLLGYYYYSNPVLYKELMEEYKRRLTNWQEIQQKIKEKNEEGGRGGAQMIRFNEKIEENEKGTNEDERLLKDILENFEKIEKINEETRKKSEILEKNTKNPLNSIKFQQNLSNSSEKLRPKEKFDNKYLSVNIEAPIFSMKQYSEKEIIAQISEIFIYKQEYVDFKEYRFLSENMLNFILKYFFEKHRFRLKKDFFSVDFRIWSFPTGFMRSLILKQENSFLNSFFGNKQKNFFQNWDFLLIPYFCSQYECFLMFWDFKTQKMKLFDNTKKKYQSKDCKNDYYVELMRNFLEKQYILTFLKPSRLYEWEYIYAEIENIQKLEICGFYIARYLYILYNMRGDFETDEGKMKEFHDNLCKFFMDVGINKKTLKEKNFVL